MALYGLIIPSNESKYESFYYAVLQAIKTFPAIKILEERDSRQVHFLEGKKDLGKLRETYRKWQEVCQVSFGIL